MQVYRQVKTPKAVKAFQMAFEKMEGKYGYSLRQMCLKAGVSEDAAGRVMRGLIKRRINSDVLDGFRKHFPEFAEVFDSQMN